MSKEIEIILPSMAESMREAVITKWHKQIGDSVEVDDLLYEIATDKIDTEVSSPAKGRLVKILVPAGEVAIVGKSVALLASSEEAQEKPKIMASPLAKKVAAQLQVEIANVSGSGLEGRILRSDVESYHQLHTSRPQMDLVPPAPQSAGPSSRVERVAMTPMRKKIAEHMMTSLKTSAHVTCAIEVDMQRVADLRAQHKEKFLKEHNFALSYTPFLLQAAIAGIKSVPIVNASLEGDTILYKKDINLSVAVALDWGLVVPVIQQAQEKNLLGLARALHDLTDRARHKKLTPEDLQGGTFSLTNFGSFGTLWGQPIINQPQVAIMGVGAFNEQAVVINRAIAIRTMAYVVLSFDHRVIDGYEAGKFLNAVRDYLEKEVTL